MTALHYYTVYAGVFAAYALGVMHGKGHTHWKNLIAVLCVGAAWPLAALYGFYLTHFKK